MRRGAAIALGALVACGGSKPAAAPPSEPIAAAPTPTDATTDASATPTPTPTPPETATPTADADAGPPAPSPPAADDSGLSGDAAGVAYMEGVQALFKSKRDALVAACWAKSKSTEFAYAGKAVIRVGPDGKVVATKTEGTDDAASACIDKQIKKWKFPPPNGTASVNLPIRLRRDSVPKSGK
jgi:hypothetical protein